MPTCLVHNCETSRRLSYSHLLSPLSQDQIPFDPHQRSSENAFLTSARLLSVRRGQPSCKGLLPPFRCPEVNHGAKGGIDWRFNGPEGYSRGRGGLFSPGEGFCLVWPAKSVLWLLLVNRFVVLDIEEVNTDIHEPIDTPPLLRTRQCNCGSQNGKRDYPNNSLSTSLMLAGHRSSCQ